MSRLSAKAMMDAAARGQIDKCDAKLLRFLIDPRDWKMLEV
jgi:hypothetical protein